MPEAAVSVEKLNWRSRQRRPKWPCLQEPPRTGRVAEHWRKTHPGSRMEEVAKVSTAAYLGDRCHGVEKLALLLW